VSTIGALTQFTRQKKALDARASGLGVSDGLGRRIRSHREESKVSLCEFARRLGISPSAVSQIETGKSRPSVSTLYAIVTELGISLDELFSPTGQAVQARTTVRPPVEPAGRKPAPAAETLPEQRHVQRADGRSVIDLESGVRWERLTPQADHEVDFLQVIYDVGGSSSHGDRFIRHSGREYGVVLSGALEVTVGFDTYQLGPGDSICFDSSVPHVLRNVGNEPVRGIWCVIGWHDDERVGDSTHASGA
jgi:transcriptional regulator with XRE-family HTH domain